LILAYSCRHFSEQKYRVADPLPDVNAVEGTTNIPQIGSRTSPTLSLPDPPR
jgi:hypothetical protein